MLQTSRAPLRRRRRGCCGAQWPPAPRATCRAWQSSRALAQGTESSRPLRPAPAPASAPAPANAPAPAPAPALKQLCDSRGGHRPRFVLPSQDSAAPPHRPDQHPAAAAPSTRGARGRGRGARGQSAPKAPTAPAARACAVSLQRTTPVQVGGEAQRWEPGRCLVCGAGSPHRESKPNTPVRSVHAACLVCHVLIALPCPSSAQIRRCLRARGVVQPHEPCCAGPAGFDC